MPRLTIKFSHEYQKLPNAFSARLVHACVVNLKDLHPEFIEYDTTYYASKSLHKGEKRHFQLKSGKYIMLMFLANEPMGRSLFTTLRPAWPTAKVDYYVRNVGNVFAIDIDPEYDK